MITVASPARLLVNVIVMVNLIVLAITVHWLMILLVPSIIIAIDIAAGHVIRHRRARLARLAVDRYMGDDWRVRRNLELAARRAEAVL